MLKTRRLGYDGKGQRYLRKPADLEPAWNAIGNVPLILEGFVHFEREVSIVGVRSTTGEVRAYPIVANTHKDGILRVTLAPHRQGGQGRRWRRCSKPASATIRAWPR